MLEPNEFGWKWNCLILSQPETNPTATVDWRTRSSSLKPRFPTQMFSERRRYISSSCTSIMCTRLGSVRQRFVTFLRVVPLRYINSCSPRSVTWQHSSVTVVSLIMQTEVDDFHFQTHGSDETLNWSCHLCKHRPGCCSVSGPGFVLFSSVCF